MGLVALEEARLDAARRASWRPRARRRASSSARSTTSSIPRASKGGINPSGEFRVKLDLFANIRPAKSRMGVGLTGKPVDLVIFRECTEGFYADRNMFIGRGEFMPTEDMAIAVRKVTARQCNRISRVAFEWARKRRKKVTAVHKANVLHISDGLFLREVRKVAQEYPGRRAR